MTEHSLAGGCCTISRPVQHIPSEGVDTAHIHARISGLVGDTDAGIKRLEVGLESLRKCGIESGQNNPGIRVVACEATCPMCCDHRFSRACATRKTKCTREIRFDVFTLFGMQESTPRGKVATFDDSAQFFVVFDVCELHLRCGALERSDDLLVPVE